LGGEPLNADRIRMRKTHFQGKKIRTALREPREGARRGGGQRHPPDSFGSLFKSEKTIEDLSYEQMQKDGWSERKLITVIVRKRGWGTFREGQRGEKKHSLSRSEERKRRKKKKSIRPKRKVQIRHLTKTKTPKKGH